MATSYNGWPASPDQAEIGVVKFGDAAGFPFPGGVKSGDVWTVLGYVMTQLHERVEACVSGWCWGYTYKANVNNPSQLSCHASGTACDWNAPLHPNGSGGTFTQSQRGTIYAILDEVQGAVDWLEGYDEMHFEIAVDASTLARIAAGLPANPPSGGPTPTPEPTPEDDDMLQLVRDVNDPNGKIYASGPNVFRHVKDGETMDSGHSAGLWDKSKVREMNARERDVVAAFTNQPNLGA